MADVLSQSEIDALLAQLSSGEVDADEMKDVQQDKKIKLYDFKSPKKLAKDQLRTLQIIHENFARSLNTFLSGYLRTYIHAEVKNVEELSYYEFSNSVVNPAVLSIVNFQPLSGQIIVDLSPSIAFNIIDRILGGSGKPFNESRTFTEIELTLIKKLKRQIIALMEQPWENVVELNPKLDKIETNSQFAQIVSHNETIALVTLSLRIGEVEGLLNICLPHLVIEPIIDKLSTRFWFASISKSVTEDDKLKLQKRVEKTRVEIGAELAHTHITVRHFLEMQVGDVIGLDTPTDGELILYVGDKMKYRGVPGTSNNHLAVRITSKEERGDELDE
ncbi:flagellar motor switch protein FliM [Anoxynatronum buryatiense]|uniref:Flagellar motor switch protein FliM n=1 Tax=Anoxynatronum buryatiense TaxID=489973 RepID=A0AA45WUC2_9CLOT|nr:flagellar motor switch protein FliM [Anoxynatronum buryatiense]SMP47328.1 flagellar motor switch protein FliM [Anoxynatronum buryatiense]